MRNYQFNLFLIPNYLYEKKNFNVHVITSIIDIVNSKLPVNYYLLIIYIIIRYCSSMCISV